LWWLWALGFRLPDLALRDKPVAMTIDDLQVEKKDRSVNELVIFYVKGSKKAYELVVNKVGANQVKGYISTPKGVTEVAAR
jgi:hypothetical protein